MLRIDMEYSRKYIHILLAVLSTSASQQFSAQAFQPSLFVKTQRNEIHSRKMFFDFHDDPIVIPDEKYDSVLDWAFESTPPLAIRKSQLGHGHGLFATQGINADSIVFKIPREKCLTLQEAKSHPTLGKSLAIMEDDLGEEFGPIAILSAYLASEMLREDCAEWEEDESLRGDYGPYVSILPTGRAVSEQDHVLWWSEKEVNDLFKGGAAHDKATALRDWADMEGSIIQGMLVTDLAEKNMGLSISQGENVYNITLFNLTIVNYFSVPTKMPFLIQS